MKKNNYVYNHNFGYGTGKLLNDINKLELKTVKDLKDYLTDLIESQIIDASVTKNTVYIKNKPIVKLNLANIKPKFK